MGDEAHKTAITSFSPLIAAKTAQFYKEVINSELSENFSKILSEIYSIVMTSRFWN